MRACMAPTAWMCFEVRAYALARSRADRVLLLAGHVHAFGPPGEALGVEQLRSAYGGRMLVLDDQGLAVADDHCHDHDHGHGAC